MAREWIARCKNWDCRNKLGYSDRSYRNSLKYGFSRPEYCNDCLENERVIRRGIGAPYFHVPYISGELVPGPLGFIEREERTHIGIEKEGQFDESDYGLTTDRIREIAKWFEDPNHRVVIVVGPTGSGKSTALPYWLVYPPEGIEEDFFTRDGQILVTQPRIVAVTDISEYLGTELMGSTVGAGFDVGFRYSREDKSDWRNAIEFTTDGKLINSIVAGRIAQYGIIIIDEAHERSENIEVIIRLLKERMGLYPNLKLIIASATIDAEFFREYFEKEGAKIIEFEGKARFDDEGNPIKYEVFYASEDEKIPYEEVSKLSKPILYAARKKAQWLIEEIVTGRKEWGDILIFLQGKKPINTLIDNLRAWVNQDEKLSEVVEVYPLYRELEKEDKRKVTQEDALPGKIRVIVSTNIAEASVTVEGLAYEIETGVEYQPRYHADIGAIKVPLVLISKANAMQRWGRTGRTRNGEVYCLYTEKQYENLFLDDPVPAMQRLSMENVILAAKAAGVTDVSQGWLDNPPEEEIERSTTALVSAGALDQKGSLTKYGAMIRWFSYPVRLIDMLLAADDIGCSVEMATLLPVIKNDGTKRLLTWKYNWDAYTKRQAHRRHQALMAGCRDDVEFILKVFKAWSELPWLYSEEIDKLNGEDIESLRKQWSKLHYVNHRVLKAIQEERDKTLDLLSAGMRGGEFREINLSQVDRVRSLLLGMLEDTERITPSEKYVYQSEIEPQTGSMVTCKVLKDEQEIYNPESWLLSRVESAKDTGELLSPLFVDQVYPVGYRFEAAVGEQEDGRFIIKTTRNLTRSKELKKEREVDVVEDGYEVEEDVEDELQEEVIPEEEPTISLFDIGIWYKGVDCSQKVIADDLSKGQKIVVEIIGYEFVEDSKPVVVTEVVPQPEPFETFAKDHRYGFEVTVEVVDVLKFANDYSAALVVKEEDTGLEVLLEPQDMSITRNAFTVTQIPLGTVLHLNVEHIDTENERVRLSNWEQTEEVFNRNLDYFLQVDEDVSVVGAKVIEVRDTGKVIFSLDWKEPESGICFITSAFGSRLPKEYTEFNIGEQVMVRIYQRDKPVYVTLPKLPAKAVSQVSEEESEGELSWKRGVLRFNGRLTYEQLYDLKTIAEEVEFHRALESLYWYSNRIFIARFLDTEWQEIVSYQYEVGTVVNGEVLEVNVHGAVIQLEEGVTGFVPRSKILGGIGDPRELLPVGSTVDVKVFEQRRGQQELLLEITEEGVDPLRKIVVGSSCRGTITGVVSYGIFVNIAPTVDGLVHYTRMYKSPRFKVEDIYREGDMVRVMVNSIDFESRDVELDMRIPENDPINKISVDQTVEGVVVNITKHGAFVAIDPGLDGLLRETRVLVASGLLGSKKPLEIEIGMKLKVRIADIDYDKRYVALEFMGRIK